MTDALVTFCRCNPVDSQYVETGDGPLCVPRAFGIAVVLLPYVSVTRPSWGVIWRSFLIQEQVMVGGDAEAGVQLVNDCIALAHLY